SVTADAMAPKAGGNPAGYVLDDTQHVVYRGTDDQVHELFFSSKQAKWSHANLTAEAKSAKVAGDPAGYVLDDTQHVVYRGPEGEGIELFNKGGGGRHPNNLPAAALAPRPAGDTIRHRPPDTTHPPPQNTPHLRPPPRPGP